MSNTIALSGTSPQASEDEVQAPCKTALRLRADEHGTPLSARCLT